MATPPVALCPRCSSRLGVEHDPDYGWCINHGPVPLSSLKPLGIPTKEVRPQTEWKCIRCHKPLSSSVAIRCVKCNGNAMRGDKRLQQRGKSIDIRDLDKDRLSRGLPR